MRSFLLALGLLAFVLPRIARAEPPPVEEEESYDFRVPEPPPALPAPGQLWLSLGGALGLGNQGSQITGMVLLGGKFDALFKQRPAPAPHAELAKDRPRDWKKPPPEPESPKPSAPAPIVTSEHGPPPIPSATERLVSKVRGHGPLIRGAVRAALRAAGSTTIEKRLDATALRARLSGLVPELRLRISHQMDEDQKLAPTEYDPDRVTASGAVSLWLEGRATFRLDRLVFADDEIALERLKVDRAKLERDLVEDVLSTFAMWQRAGATLESEGADEQARFKAEVEAAVAEARLDALTDGWFGRAVAETVRQKLVSSAPQEEAAGPVALLEAQPASCSSSLSF